MLNTKRIARYGNRGKDRRNAILEKVLRYLWVGDVTSASEYLASLDPADIKNRKWVDDLLGYFGKKGDAITCYVLRTKLELSNSCNSIEKASGLIVAGRQNTMEWLGLPMEAERLLFCR